MGLSIKNPETEGLIRRLSEQRGVSLTRAVHDAVAKEVKPANRTVEEIEAEIERMLAWTRAQDGWQPDPLPSQKEMDSWIYDEDGMPTR